MALLKKTGSCFVGFSYLVPSPNDPRPERISSGRDSPHSASKVAAARAGGTSASASASSTEPPFRFGCLKQV